MTSLRQHAEACIRAGIAAAEPERLVREWLERHPDAIAGADRVRLAAVGKAAAAMTRGAVAAVGDALTGGVLIVPEGADTDLPGRFETFHGGHPVPTDEGARGARAVHDLADGLGEDDLLLTLISGGGSALMTLPPEEISLEDVRTTTDSLLRAGADIRQLNTVRKHLDRLKGGRLARSAHPAQTVALVLSDVVGDPLDTIASGPVSPDPTTYEDALLVLQRLDLLATIPGTVRRHLERGRAGEIEESPAPGDPAFEHTRAHIVGSNRLAAEAAVKEAQRLGYAPLLLSTRITGEARHVGRILAGIGADILQTGTPLAPPACIIAGGETTVTVTGQGKGGRNQEVALGAAVALDELLGDTDRGDTPHVLIASAGTDGIDGPTDAAGAVATPDTVHRARERGLDPHQALTDNDAHPFFDRLGDLLRTGPTGTNVMDLMVVLVR